MTSPFDSAAGWILNSGIQNITSDASKNGSFNSWYDLDSGAYPFMYSEITGYGITTLLYLHDITGKKVFLERAKLAGDWLLGQALHDCGGLIAKIYHDGTVDGRVFSFDNGMALYGLANLARVSGIDAYADGAETIGQFLLSAQKSNGEMNAIFDTSESIFVNRMDKWSTQPGGYHAKVALGLIDASNALGKTKYMVSAERLCDASMAFQEESGRFVSDGNTHLHPHSYACEGLFYASHSLKRPDFLRRAETGVRWVLGLQMGDGGLPTLFSPKGVDENQRTDILGQVTRLGVLMLQEGRLPEHKASVDSLFRRLMLSQNTAGQQAGGFYFGHENAKRVNHVNSWCSMFGLQAIRFHDEYLKKNKVKIDYFV